jgi:hypothetical protein
MSELIEGEVVNLGGKPYTVPALTLRQIKALGGKIQALSGLNPLSADEAALDPLLDVAHAALSRNYPDLKREEMDDLVDLRNVLPLVNAILNTSGFKRSGEAPAGSQ